MHSIPGRLCVLAFVLGTAVLQSRPALPPAWVGALVPVAAACAWWACGLGRGRAGAAWAVVAAFALGFAYAAESARSRLADRLPAEWEDRDIVVVGVVSALTEGGERSVRFDVEVEEVLTPGAVVPRRIGLALYREIARRGGRPANEALPAIPRAAERWRLAVRLKRPHGTANPYGFDLEAWLLERGTRATGTVRRDVANRRLSTFVVRPSFAIERAREWVRDRFRERLPGAPYEPVLTALVVGDQSAIPRHDWEVFWRTGVGHLISISGVHVTLIAGLCAAAVRLLWARAGHLALRLPAPRAGAYAGIAAAAAYALLAGFSVPTQRTLWMCCAVAWAAVAGAGTSPSRILCAALLAVSTIDPWASLQAGFLLSFGAVAFILYGAVNRTGRPGRIAEAVRTQWSVTLAMLPMQARLFRQVSVVSPIANAFAIPLVGTVVVPLAMLGAALPYAWPMELAHAAFRVCMFGLEPLAALPWAVWTPRAPDATACVLGLAGVAWGLLPGGFPARWLGLPLLLPIAWPAPVPLPEQAYRLTVLDVGQGLAAVVETRGHRLLYDTGPSLGPDADVASRVVIPHLLATGGRHLDGLIVSHRDADHSGGAVSVLERLDVDWLLSSLETDHRILAHSRRSIRCSAGQHWRWDGVDFDVLHPLESSYAGPSPTNARGCVLRIRSLNGVALLPADIEAVSEGELLARSADVAADVVVAPHHGSTTSSTAAFVAATHARWVVYANGYRNRFGHPKPAVTRRWAEAGAASFRSDADGAVSAEFSEPGRPGLRAYRREEARYWFEARGPGSDDPGPGAIPRRADRIRAPCGHSRGAGARRCAGRSRRRGSGCRAWCRR
jgi:competence protein ComEC